MTLRASIDLGTNTCLLLIAKWNFEKNDVDSLVGDYSTIVRLGQGVDQNRKLNPDAMLRTLACLKNYSDKIRKNNLRPEDTICVATSQARDASNSNVFFIQVEKETGFHFRTLHGDQEARLSFWGSLLPEMAPENHAVIDIGGGSTEFMSEQCGYSLNLGSVRFTERYLKSDPVTDEEFWKCQEQIDHELVTIQGWRETHGKTSHLVANAGTATTLAAWHLGLNEFDSQSIDKTTLTRGDIHRMVEELKWRTIQERKQLIGIEPQRADVLLAGAMILWRAMELLRFSDCRISSRGLRYGVLKNSSNKNNLF